MRGLFTLIFSIIMLFFIHMHATADDNSTYLSEEIQQYCFEIGEEYGVSPYLLMAIIETESRGQADAENGNCKGLMQISVKWHTGRMEHLGVTDIFDIRGNILIGADLLTELYETYGDMVAALMVYHGEKNVAEKAANGEISNYARKILERSAELEEVYEQEETGFKYNIFDVMRINLDIRLEFVLPGGTE